MYSDGKVGFHEVGVEDLDSAFELIHDQLVKAISHSGLETRPEWIKGSLYLGSIKLYLVSVGPEIAGWIMTEITPGNSGAWVNIPFGYSDVRKAQGIDLFAAGLEQLKETCRQMNFRGIRWLSARKGMYRRSTRLGAKARFVEYIMEVESD